MTPGQTADFIVVGAGSAGCVVASRLSEDPAVSVLLIEAGASDWTRQTRIPAALSRTLGNPRFDWRLRTEPDPSRDNRADQWSRGRLPGGSSSLNGLIYVRATREDFDGPAWSANPGWDWSAMHALYRRAETSAVQSGQERGAHGPVHVELSAYRHPLTDPFIAAAERRGVPFNPDINGASRLGIGYCPANIRRGVRQSAFDAYIRPHARRPNLRVLTGRTVSRVLFEDGAATGIETVEGRVPAVHTARRGVVLSCGTFHTPHLLMLSGVGPGRALAAAGIPVVADRVEVGQNLMDHVGVRMPFLVDHATLNTQARLHRSAVHAVRWLVDGKGPVGAPSAQAIGFCGRTGLSDPPDLQLTLFPFANVVDGRGRAVLPDKPYMAVAVNLNYPRSRGHLSLRTDDPRAQIRIHPRLLDHPDDQDCMLDGMARAREIIDSEPFAAHVTAVEFPDGSGGRNADLAFLRANARSFMHPIGTCRMGPDAGSVVGPDLQVRGTRQLWVADASVFPAHVTGNINATVIAVGEKAADLIRAATPHAVH